MGMKKVSQEIKWRFCKKGACTKEELDNWQWFTNWKYDWCLLWFSMNTSRFLFLVFCIRVKPPTPSLYCFHIVSVSSTTKESSLLFPGFLSTQLFQRTKYLCFAFWLVNAPSEPSEKCPQTPSTSWMETPLFPYVVDFRWSSRPFLQSAKSKSHKSGNCNLQSPLLKRLVPPKSTLYSMAAAKPCLLVFRGILLLLPRPLGESV